MARALWKGSITFGLVSIPVELYPAEDRKEFKFSMLDKRDLSPVGYKRYSKLSGKEVEWSDVVKGYEYEKDQYVVLSEEDFRRANVKASRTLEIQSFVADNEIAPEFFETPYYLVPGERGEKVYALLRETLRSTHRVGIGQFVLRASQHLAAVKPSGRALVLVMLRYANELKGTSGLELPAAGLKEARVTPKEIELAKRLIDDMTEQWDPGRYEDTYHEDLMTRIKEKIKKGETREIAQPAGDEAGEPQATNVIDLAALLKRSLGREGSRRAPGQERGPRTGTASRLRVVESRPASRPAARRKRA